MDVGTDETTLAEVACLMLKVGSLFRVAKVTTGCNLEGYGAGSAAIAAATVHLKNGTPEQMEKAMVLAMSPTIGVPCTPRVLVPALCTAHVGGAILGAALYNRRLKLSGCILTAFVNGLVVSLILNTTMISLVFGPPLGPLFLTRLGQFGIMLCVQTLVLFFLERSDTLYNKIISLRD